MGQQKPGEKQSNNANHGCNGSEIRMENKQEDEKAAATAMQLGKGTTQMTTVLNPVKNETVRYIKCSGLFLTRRYSRSIKS